LLTINAFDNLAPGDFCAEQEITKARSLRDAQ
jgi:hypothetical protein